MRHHGVGTTVAVCSEKPHRLQNRRVDGLPSPQSPQIRSFGCSGLVGGAFGSVVDRLLVLACWGIIAAG